MGTNPFNRTRQFLWIAAAIALLFLLGYALKKQGASASYDDAKQVQHPEGALVEHPLSSSGNLDPVLQINSDVVLASVNGHALTAADVLPPGSSNQVISQKVCEYYLHRAIDRELIFQTAKAKGIELDESQKQQIADFKTMRGQHGPGVAQELNGGAAQLAFEERDAEAFMLQTSLLERSGASPNVTADQVLAYYQQHASDFGELPTDEPAHSQAWQIIDEQIRHKLASDVRSHFQVQLVDYMQQMKSGANIQLTPLTTFAAAE